MLKHTHAIIIIKNKKNEFLQYYDNRWDSFLFPNCKLISENHKELIQEYLLEALNLKTDKISLLFDKVHEKFSESAKIMKQYHHYFYLIEDQPLINKEKGFDINDIHYSWLSLHELETNERIQKVNKDIVDFIKNI